MTLPRTTDPSTSHQAGALMEASGATKSHCAICLAAVIAHPSLTAAELAPYAGLERHEVSRRLANLRHAFRVGNGPSRVCTVTNNRSMTWVALS